MAYTQIEKKKGKQPTYPITSPKWFSYYLFFMLLCSIIFYVLITLTIRYLKWDLDHMSFFKKAWIIILSSTIKSLIKMYIATTLIEFYYQAQAPLSDKRHSWMYSWRRRSYSWDTLLFFIFVCFILSLLEFSEINSTPKISSRREGCPNIYKVILVVFLILDFW